MCTYITSQYTQKVQSVPGSEAVFSKTGPQAGTTGSRDCHTADTKDHPGSSCMEKPEEMTTLLAHPQHMSSVTEERDVRACLLLLRVKLAYLCPLKLEVHG